MSYANRTLRSIPFGRIIGGPMTAAVQAQALAAQTTVNFIKEVGFKNPGTPVGDEADGDFGDVRNVVFKYSRKKAEGGESSAEETETVSLTVPILTIVPIPYLRIDELNIQFTARITEQQEFKSSSASSGTVSTDTRLNFKAGGFFSPVKVDMNAQVSTRHTNTSSSSASRTNKADYTMDIQLKAVQDEMPGGLAKVLNILETAIFENRLPGGGGGGGN